MLFSHLIQTIAFYASGLQGSHLIGKRLICMCLQSKICKHRLGSGNQNGKNKIFCLINHSARVVVVQHLSKPSTDPHVYLQIDKKAMHKAGMVQRVINEVEIQCRLKHPSILEVSPKHSSQTFNRCSC